MTKANPVSKAIRAERQRRAAEARDETYRTYQRLLSHQRRDAEARRYEKLGRVPSPDKDPALVDPDTNTIRLCFLKEAEHIFPTDHDLYSFIDAQVDLNREKSGRPTHLETRTVLIILWFHVVLSKEMFVLSAITGVLERLHWRSLRTLGVDCDRAGRPTPLRYGKLLDAVHRIADAFDPYADGLSDEERRQRETALLELQKRMCDMSLVGAPSWRGNGAIDATLKWSWERPYGAKSKTWLDEKAGQPATPLGEVLDGLDPAEAFVDLDVVAQAKTLPVPARKKNRPATWGRGSCWVGRDKATKSVHGIALNSVTSTDEDSPAVIVAHCVSPANVNAADVGYRLVQDLFDGRVLDDAVVAEVDAGRSQYLGDISADPAYGMMPERWQLPLRALGANCLFRLHKGNQSGSRWRDVGTGKTAELVLFEDGSPICGCGPDALRNRKYPH